MKTTRHHPAALLALLATLPTATLLAQVQPSSEPADSARRGVNPAANASVALNNGGNPAAAIGAAQMPGIVPSSAAVISGNAGTVGVNGDTGNQIAASAASGMSTVSTGNFESIGMRRERLRAASASDSPAIVYSGPAVVPRDTGTRLTSPVALEIRSTDLAARDQLAAQLDTNIAAGERTMRLARREAQRLSGPARSQFDSAAAEVRTAERRLQRSLKAVQQASADEWVRTRAALAADYEAYAAAVNAAQRIALTAGADTSPALDPR